MSVQTRALSVRARLTDAEAVPAKLFEKMTQQTDSSKALKDVGLFTVTEQELWRYQQTRHPVALAALYPGDALLEADYPLLLTPKAAGDDELYTLLRDCLRLRFGDDVILGEGGGEGRGGKGDHLAEDDIEIGVGEVP